MLLYGGREHKQLSGGIYEADGRISTVIDRLIARGRETIKNIGAYMEPGPRIDWLPEGTDQTKESPQQNLRVLFTENF